MLQHMTEKQLDYVFKVGINLESFVLESYDLILYLRYSLYIAGFMLAFLFVLSGVTYRWSIASDLQNVFCDYCTLRKGHEHGVSFF